MSNILIIIYPTQLFEFKYLNKILSFESSDSNKLKTKKYIIIHEHPYFFAKYPYHKMKLVFHRATMRKYYDDLKMKLNIKIEYVCFNEKSKISKFIKKKSINEIRYFNPIEMELIEEIHKNKHNVKHNLIFSTPYFINSKNFETNQQLLSNLTYIKHNLFYKLQRIRLNIMIEKKFNKIVPDGLKWSFDVENRKTFIKPHVENQQMILKNANRKFYLLEAEKYVKLHWPNNYGILDLNNFIYPIDHIQSIKWLKFFVKNKLENFGKYQDALSSKIKFGYHSLLSPLINIGLITTTDIIKEVLLAKTKMNLPSIEGFIRQIIGWREYCYFTYDLYKIKLQTSDFYNFNSKSIPNKIWKCQTLIPPIDTILHNLNLNGYSHHIERLMGIGNFLILIGVAIPNIYDWFQTMYIDAYDVFMTPNIYGMLAYGKLDERTHMMNRPYICGSNYLLKMSDYKSNQKITIESIEYSWTEILDSLYWSHINTYAKKFKSIYATASTVNKWKKNPNQKNILQLANKYIKWLYNNDNNENHMLKIEII